MKALRIFMVMALGIVLAMGLVACDAGREIRPATISYNQMSQSEARAILIDTVLDMVITNADRYSSYSSGYGKTMSKEAERSQDVLVARGIKNGDYKFMQPLTANNDHYLLFVFKPTNDKFRKYGGVAVILGDSPSFSAISITSSGTTAYKLKSPSNQIRVRVGFLDSIPNSLDDNRVNELAIGMQSFFLSSKFGEEIITFNSANKMNKFVTVFKGAFPDITVN